MAFQILKYKLLYWYVLIIFKVLFNKENLYSKEKGKDKREYYK